MADLTNSDLKLGSKHSQALMPKVWVADVNCPVRVDDYLAEMACRLLDTDNADTNLSEANDAASNTAALQQAIDDKSASTKKVVRIPEGVFDINNILITSDDIILEGSGMPDINKAKDQLLGGTVLRGGRIDVDGKYNITIRNLGIDVSGTLGSDAISSGPSQPGEQRLKVQNVVTLGGDGGHGVVCTSGDYNIIENFHAYHFNHPFALRCSYSRVTGYLSYNCLNSGGIIKSVNDGGIINAYNNLISQGLILVPTLGAGRGFMFDAFSTGTECLYNVVSDLTMRLVNFGISLGGAGACRHNSISNCNLFRCSQNALLISDAATQNRAEGIRSHLTGGDSFVNNGTGTQNDLFGCHSVGQTGANTSGTFRTVEVLN